MKLCAIVFPVFLQTSAINQTFINSRLVQKTCEPCRFSYATGMQKLLFSCEDFGGESLFKWRICPISFAVHFSIHVNFEITKELYMDRIQRYAHKETKTETSIVLNIVHWLCYLSYTRHFGCWLIQFVLEVSYENWQSKPCLFTIIGSTIRIGYWSMTWLVIYKKFLLPFIISCFA